MKSVVDIWGKENLLGWYFGVSTTSRVAEFR